MRDWEPRLAVVGAEHTERIAGDARGVLEPGGAIVLECHEHRASRVLMVLELLGYRRASVAKDLAGRERVVEAQWEPET